MSRRICQARTDSFTPNTASPIASTTMATVPRRCGLSPRSSGRRALTARLGERADLVHLDEHGVGQSVLDRLLDDGGVRHEHVVAHQLHPAPELAGQRSPPRDVVLAETVLDRDDRIAVEELLVPMDHLLAREDEVLRSEEHTSELQSLA